MTQAYTQDYDQLLDEAAGWIARLRSDRVSVRDKQDFSQWLNLSDDHCRAFDDMATTWGSTAAAAYLPGIQEQLSEQPNTERPQQNTKPQDEQTVGHWWSGFGLWQGGLAMACVAGIIAIITLLPGAPQIQVDNYHTGAGEQRQITLADGSIIDLNTRTHLQVSMQSDKRQLRLLTGEAYFQVAKDKQRPFVVDVGAGTVTAVGTAFNILHHREETRVLVTEGIVQLREQQDAATPNPATERLLANQQAGFGKRGLTATSTGNREHTLAWRDKTLIFDQLPLPAALEQLNRYLPHPVDGEDDTLKDLRVSGTFSLTAPQETLQALLTSFDLKLEQQRVYRPAASE